MDAIEAKPLYERYLTEWSDIQDHLPRLKAESHGVVVELGTRGGVSTSALLAGIEEKCGHLWSIDTDNRSRLVFEGHPAWTFVNASSLELKPMGLPGINGQPIDLLFVDTLHTFEHVFNELMIWVPFVRDGANILIHDAETFKGTGEAVRTYAEMYGLPWELVTGSNGLGVIHKGAMK